jgi:hypothetical protein
VAAASSEQFAFRVESEITDAKDTMLVTATGSYRTISLDQARANLGDDVATWAADRGYLAGCDERKCGGE